MKHAQTTPVGDSSTAETALRPGQCVIFDDDRGEDFSSIEMVLRDFGFTPVLVHSLGELGVLFHQYSLSHSAPCLFIIDVHIPDYADFSMLGYPEVEIPDENTAGIQLYDKIIFRMSTLRDVPVIFISNHNNIAIFDAHRFRTQQNRHCYFVSKTMFAREAPALLSRLNSMNRQPEESAFSSADYEHLWSGVSEFFDLNEKEKFAALGLLPDTHIDILTFIDTSRDVRGRIDMFVDIGLCLNLLYPERPALLQAIRGRDRFGMGLPVKEIVVSGDYYKIKMLLLRLETLCGVR